MVTWPTFFLEQLVNRTILLLVVSLVALSGTASAVQYHATSIGALPGTEIYLTPTAINSAPRRSRPPRYHRNRSLGSSEIVATRDEPNRQ